MRAESLKSVLDNWSDVNMLWDNSLEEKLDHAMRGRIIGVQSEMSQLLFWHLCFTTPCKI